jgi:hypothetical protein
VPIDCDATGWRVRLPDRGRLGDQGNPQLSAGSPRIEPSARSLAIRAALPRRASRSTRFVSSAGGGCRPESRGRRRLIPSQR